MIINQIILTLISFLYEKKRINKICLIQSNNQPIVSHSNCIDCKPQLTVTKKKFK